MKDTTSILRQRRILQNLIDFANDGRLQIIKGIIVDLDGIPIIHVSQVLAQAITGLPDARLQDLHVWLKTCLEGICINADQTMLNIGVSVNQMGFEMSTSFVYDQQGPGYFVPDPKTPLAFILALLMVTITANDNGKPLLARVSRCNKCQRFFIRKTHKYARFCSRACRTKHFNDWYTSSGLAKQWYQKRKGVAS